jgi:hypothetical protein
MVSIGLVSGPQSSGLEEYLRRLMPLFERQRAVRSGYGLVNVVFHSPLALRPADHSGLATGAFSRRDKKIVVAVAVPLEVVRSTPQELAQYVRSSLHAAVDHGLAAMATRGVNLHDEAFHEFVDFALAAGR